MMSATINLLSNAKRAIKRPFTGQALQKSATQDSGWADVSPPSSLLSMPTNIILLLSGSPWCRLRFCRLLPPCPLLRPPACRPLLQLRRAYRRSLPAPHPPPRSPRPSMGRPLLRPLRLRQCAQAAQARPCRPDRNGAHKPVTQLLPAHIPAHAASGYRYSAELVRVPAGSVRDGPSERCVLAVYVHAAPEQLVGDSARGLGERPEGHMDARRHQYV